MDQYSILGKEKDEMSLEKYNRVKEEKSLWEMAVDRQKHLEELELKYAQLYDEGKEDGFKLAIRIAVEGKYHEDVGVWLHELSMAQLRAIIRVMAVVDDIAIFKQIIEVIR